MEILDDMYIEKLKLVEDLFKIRMVEFLNVFFFIFKDEEIIE